MIDACFGALWALCCKSSEFGENWQIWCLGGVIILCACCGTCGVEVGKQRRDMQLTI